VTKVIVNLGALGLRGAHAAAVRYPEVRPWRYLVKAIQIKLIALAIGLAFSAGATAQSMSKNDYNAAKAGIEAQTKSAIASCASLSGNAKDICVVEAKGKAKVALADLEASYKPSTKAHYQARVTKAEADYAVAKERCDDVAGNVKDVCVKEAQAAQTAAKADAKAQMKTSEANATAREKSTEARTQAKSESTAARKDAAQEKRDADYKVAKEKCDAFASDAKDRCLADAKARFAM
jgi:hypothetical protein